MSDHDDLPDLPTTLTDRLFATLHGDPERRTLSFAALQQEYPEHAEALKRHLDHYQALQGHSISAGGDDEPSIPGYVLLGVLGEGGMGTVYRARQVEPLQRFVAVKVIQRGLNSRRVLARFEHERQALAAMDHDAIARVFDCGATAGGQPFIAMELVDGLPIHRYCDRYRIGLRERIELFVQVCQGVQHAHQKGVIHRDLKPGNVLVAAQEGRHAVKIIDFGVARALDHGDAGDSQATEQGTIVGTRGYMSPEQAAGDTEHVDTRSDVYSLGVILYELLVGELPFTNGSAMYAGQVSQPPSDASDTPPKPSTRLTTASADIVERAALRDIGVDALRRELQRDLDWVVLKAMARDPDRRYGTPIALADDLRRYLSHEPLVAGPPSTAYRLRKLIRRHRVQVMAGAAVLVSLLGGGAGMTVQYVRAEERAVENAELAKVNGALAAAEASARQEAQRRVLEAQQRADELEKVLAFHESQWEGADAETMGNNLRRTLLDAAPEDRRAGLERDLAGVNFTNIALDSLRRELLDRSLAAVASGFDDQPLVKARLLHSLGGTLHDLGFLESARAASEEQLELLRAAHGDRHVETALAMSSLAAILAELDRTAEAEALLADAIDVLRSELGEDDEETLRARQNLATMLSLAGRHDEAEAAFAELVPRCRRRLGPDDLQTLTAIRAWGMLAMMRTDLDAAETRLQEALDGMRRTLGPDSPEPLETMTHLAMLLLKRGDLPAAEQLVDEALAGHRRIHGDEHTVTLETMETRGALLQQQGRVSEALTLAEQVLDVRRRLLGPDHRLTLASMQNVGVIADALGRLEEGEQILREVLERSERVLGERDPDTQRALDALAGCLMMQGRLVEAIEVQRRSVALAVELHGPGGEHALMARKSLGALLIRRGQFDEAEALLRDVLETGRQVLGASNYDVLGTQQYLVDLLIARGGAQHVAEAEALQRDCVEQFVRLQGPDTRDVLIATGRLATVLETEGRFADALPLRQRIVDGMRIARGATHPETLSETSNLGCLFFRLGRPDEAAQTLAPLLQEYIARFGEGSEFTQGVRANLAFVYVELGRYEEAEPLLRAVLDALRAREAEASPLGFAAANSLANLLQHTGKLDDAEHVRRSARDRCLQQLGEDAHMTWLATLNLGTLLLEKGSLDEAEALLRATVDSGRRALGATEDTAHALDELANLLQQRGAWHEAVSLRREALQLLTGLRGEEAPPTLTATSRLAEALERSGEHAEALRLHRRAVKGLRSALGDDAADTLKARAALAELLFATGRLDEAEREYEQLIGAHVARFGEDTVNAQALRTNLGTIYARTGRYSEAEPLLRATFAWSREHLGPADATTLAIADTLGVLLSNTERYDDAEALCRSTLEGCNEGLSPTHPLTLRATLNLGMAVLRREQHDEAIRLLAPIEQAMRATFAGDNVEVQLYHLILLGKAYTGRAQPGDHGVGEALLLDAYRQANAASGDGGHLTQWAVRSLVLLYESWAKHEPGAGHDAQAERWRAKRVTDGR